MKRKKNLFPFLLYTDHKRNKTGENFIQLNKKHEILMNLVIRRETIYLLDDFKSLVRKGSFIKAFKRI